MPLRDEQADILGGPILQRPEAGAFATFSRFHFVFKSMTLFGLGLLLWAVSVRGLEHLKKRRELRYRKAMRRKHGIPDSDCRPFAVAYAAAKRVHHGRVAQNRKTMSDHNSSAVGQRSDAQEGACALRRRVPETTVQLCDHQIPGIRAPAQDRPDIRPLDFMDHYNPDPRRRMAISESFPVEGSSVRPASEKELLIVLGDGEEPRKRSLEEGDFEHEAVKRSRMNGDEQAYGRHSRVPSRGAVGGPLDRRQSGGDFAHMNGQERSKRADELDDEDRESLDEAMEGVSPTKTMDLATDLNFVARGKKRDRAEAGSSFGGDEDDEIRNGRASHHRKRRTISRRIEIPARGQKRDREVESPRSDSEGVDSETCQRHAQRRSKKKRGSNAGVGQVIEMSVEDPCVSKDPLCGGRSVGDDWETDGIQYKVGDKGERLRLALVKKAMNKYHMPQDSQHPDRLAALEIYVERWMTEEQYKQAESRQELAWQESREESSRSKPPDVLDSPAQNGKSLLWDSVTGGPASRPHRKSIPLGNSARINPFQHWQLQPTLGRRVASSSATVPPILSGDSPIRSGVRGFSKWEKQDREAEAMTRIRAKIEEQKKTQAPQKPAEIPTSVTAADPGTKPLSVPTITLTPTPAVAAEDKSDDSTLQNKSKLSTFSFVTPSSTSDSIKRFSTAAASTTTPGFSLPSTPGLAVTPSTLLPHTPTTIAPSTPSFSFTKPIPTPGVSPKLPNIFGKGM